MDDCIDSNKARVCMYVQDLDDSLVKKAGEIKEFLRKESKVKYELEKTDYDKMSIGMAVRKAEEKVRKKECKNWLFNPLYRILSWLSSLLYRRIFCFSLLSHDDDDDDDDGKSLSGENVVHVKRMQDLMIDKRVDEPEGETAGTHEVVVILGHSSVFNFGPFSISDILEAILRHKPVIVAFLGCCGGSVRHGPMLMISQMNGLETIFGFYQRRIYIDELIQTSLLTGIRNYLRFPKKLNGVEPRIIAKRSFVQAALELKVHHPTPEDDLTGCCEHVIPDDPTIFANDSDDKSTAQLFLSTLKEKFSSTEKIPLSCLQLALFHIYTFEEASDSGPSINNFIKEIKNLEVDKIEENCRSEIKKRHLDKFIEMIATIQLAHVSPETLTDLKHGKWQSVDHLQFFVAILHGHWGKNSCENIRSCACYHLEEMRKEVDMCDGSSIQKYCLCAIGFCMFCENTYVSFELKACYVIGLVLYSELGFTPKTINFDCVTEKGDLPWIDRFDDCDKVDEYIKLFKKEVQAISMSNYYEREIKKDKTDHQYTFNDLTGALHALQHYLFNTDDPPIDYEQYEVKEFHNKTSSRQGRMSCFKPFRNDIVLRYIETRVTSQCNNTPIICRCRFVYQYFLRDGKICIGCLYFTDSHYGWDLIPEDKVDERLTADIRNKNFYEKFHELSKMEIFDLQNSIKRGFPFVNIGKLIIRKSNYKLDHFKST